MLAVIKDYIVDKFLTWHTGYNKQARTWNKWQEETIVRNARTIENMFINFKYIIPVTTKIFDLAEPFGWYPCEDVRQYMYPIRELGDNLVYYFARGSRDQWDGQFHLDDCFGEGDQVFVATNNGVDAIMMALKYS
jgi:hypothetical protein